MQMAEPTCLMRSFSQPSESSRNLIKGDPARCLGESISFGRYMSEPLAWEKWSAFSSNRYLEEAEKYSKPGSVAKMKAYFEGYYKSIASRKRAAKEEEASRSTDLEVNGVEENLSCSDSDSPQENDSASDKPSNLEDCNLDFSSALAPAPEEEEYHILQENDLSCSYSDTPQENDSASDKPSNLEGCNLKFRSTITVPEKKEGYIIKDSEYITPEFSLENFVQVNCLDDLEAQLERQPSNELEKLKCTPEVESLKVGNDLEKLKSEMKSGDSNIRRLVNRNPPASLEMEQSKKGDDQKRMNSKIKNVPDSNSRISHYCKPLKLPTSRSRVVASHPAKEGCTTPSNKQWPKDNLQSKALPSTSLHKSVKFDVLKKSSRTVQKSLIENPLTPSAKIMMEKATPSQTPNRVSVAGKLKHISATPQTEFGRSISTPGRSLSRGRTRGPELQPSSLVNIKPSSSCGFKARASITFSPFNFRTEERAAKRREFFLKQQEKEAEKPQQLEKTKQERVNTGRKLLHTIGLKNKTAVDSNIKSSRQVSSTHLQPKPLKKSDALKIKEGKKDLRCYQSTSLSKKNRHENASPNIL